MTSKSASPKEAKDASRDLSAGIRVAALATVTTAALAAVKPAASAKEPSQELESN